MKREIKNLRAEIHDNGFIRKDVAGEMIKASDNVHKKLDGDIQDLRERVKHLEVERH